MAKYCKKPVVIEAVQWNGLNSGEILNFGNSGPQPLWGDDFKIHSPESTVLISTLEGTMAAETGDWIIRGIKGEFYPCKPDIFEATYEAVTEETPEAQARRFALVREEDVSGVSGTGVVATGIQFPTGRCVMEWLTEITSVAIYANITELETIHGHDGKTQVRWLDEEN